jgi:hypothetical protein
MSAPYLGDYAAAETVHFMWNSNSSTGASITRSTDGTISVYKDNSDTQTTTGVTDTENVDGLTGVHRCVIATSDSFYTTATDFMVVLSAATIDTQTVNAVLAHFSIENRSALRPTTAGRTLDVSAGGEAGVDWANVGSPTTVSGAVGSVTGAVGSVTGAVGSVGAGGITATSIANGAIDAATFAAGAIDAAAIADGAIDAATFAAGAITAAAIADGAIDAATFAANAITATVVADGTIDAATFAANAITATVIADGAIDAATFAAGAITATVIATDAIDADALAADALAEINAQVVDGLNVDTYAEPGQGTPAATASLVTKIGYLYKAWRNRHTQTATEYALYADDATTKDQEAAVSDDAVTFERGEVATGA